MVKLIVIPLLFIGISANATIPSPRLHKLKPSSLKKEAENIHQDEREIVNTKAWTETATDIYTRDAYDQIYAVDFNISRFEVETNFSHCKYPQVVATATKSGAMLGYFNLNFGSNASNPAKFFEIRHSSNRVIPSFKLAIRLDSQFGELIAYVLLPTANGRCSDRSKTDPCCFVFWFSGLNTSKPLTGIHHVYFSFSYDPSIIGPTFHLVWFQFYTQDYAPFNNKRINS